MTIVVADLGATNARFAILKKGELSDVYQFACDDFKDPITMISSFIYGYAKDAKYLLCGVPGPVLKNEVKWTNRAWKLNAKKVKSKLKLKDVVLMNDLQVQGNALSELRSHDLLYFRRVKKAQGPKVLVNIGTGLGVCYIVNGEVFGSEYGQIVMPEGYLLEKHISGPGFKSLHQKLTNSVSPTSALMIEQEYAHGNCLAKKTYQLFYMEFAQALMNLALMTKATGGVYFCGGILDERTLKQMNFAKNFVNHPKMETLLKSMPLIFIKKKDFAFLGLKMLARKFGWS